MAEAKYYLIQGLVDLCQAALQVRELHTLNGKSLREGTLEVIQLNPFAQGKNPTQKKSLIGDNQIIFKNFWGRTDCSLPCTLLF